jgi:hypothetical protein
MTVLLQSTRMGLARALRLLFATSLVVFVVLKMWDRWQFEGRLSQLQDFCATVPTDITKAGAEARVRDTAHLETTQVDWVEDRAWQSLIIHDTAAPGWICEVALHQGVVREHAFGSDHGARWSFFDR